MLAFPNIKINLGLSITEKRPDGYHNLETVFYPVALEDALEIRTSSETEKKIILHQYGMEIAGNPEDNLVAKAYSLLDKEFHLPPVEIHLYKHIPSLSLLKTSRPMPKESETCSHQSSFH